MCKICKNSKIYQEKFNEIFLKIAQRAASTSQNEGVAFSTIPFPPQINFALFEPRMALQLPSNFYQNVIIDGQRLRNDWSSGWLREIGFRDGRLFFITHAFRFDKETNTEKILYLYIVEFEKEQWSAKEEAGKIVITVGDVRKAGKNLITGQIEEHTFSFSFTHQPTDRAIVPRDRIETSTLVRSIYKGKLPQKPLTFDWTEYIVATPTFCVTRAYSSKF